MNEDFVVGGDTGGGDGIESPAEGETRDRGPAMVKGVRRESRDLASIASVLWIEGRVTALSEKDLQERIDFVKRHLGTLRLCQDYQYRFRLLQKIGALEALFHVLTVLQPHLPLAEHPDEPSVKVLLELCTS